MPDGSKNFEKPKAFCINCGRLHCFAHPNVQHFSTLSNYLYSYSVYIYFMPGCMYHKQDHKKSNIMKWGVESDLYVPK